MKAGIPAFRARPVERQVKLGFAHRAHHETPVRHAAGSPAGFSRPSQRMAAAQKAEDSPQRTQKATKSWGFVSFDRSLAESLPSGANLTLGALPILRSDGRNRPAADRSAAQKS